MALENQASSDRAGYRIPVQITESGHVDLARVRWFTSSEIGATVSLKSIRRAPGRHQGNRISDLGEDFGEICVLPSRPLDLDAQGALGRLLANEIEGHVTEDSEV